MTVGLGTGRAAAGRRALRWLVAAACGIVLASCAASAAPTEGNVYVVGSFPVEAQAQDAVKAKEKALADGQQAAFRSLLKRIVPVTAYKQLKRLRQVKAANLIDGFSVRSERNSSTEYIATYDFSFQSGPVQKLLESEGIPFVDKQAPRIVIVPAYIAGPQQPGAKAEASDTWTYAWRGLDLLNTVTPVTLRDLKREVHADTLKALLAGDGAAHRALSTEYQTSLLVVAALAPDADGKKVQVTLAGQDSVGPLFLKRTYKLNAMDFQYAAELAAVVSLGILEGRWKAANAPTLAAHQPAPDPADQPAGGGWSPQAAPGGGGVWHVHVEFNGMGEWQQISRQISRTPGVSDVDVEGLSPRGARIAFRFPGGADALAQALGPAGLTLRQAGSGWVLSGR